MARRDHWTKVHIWQCNGGLSNSYNLPVEIIYPIPPKRRTAMIVIGESLAILTIPPRITIVYQRFYVIHFYLFYPPKLTDILFMSKLQRNHSSTVKPPNKRPWKLLGSTNVTIDHFSPNQIDFGGIFILWNHLTQS